ncbi:UNVERIFIED_CONTAM: hypothetical protein FKN15_003845 [Acipenser sinensis]
MYSCMFLTERAEEGKSSLSQQRDTTDSHTSPVKTTSSLETFIFVQLGQADVKCPIPECSAHLEESMVVAHLPNEEVVKYKYFLELSRVGSSTKPCPQCKHFTTIKKTGNVESPSKAENKYKILCEVCQLVWCFKCHSPWHEGLNCRDYKKGDKLLRHWASEIEHGQRNAQKCPRCKIHIQRTEGCDHMTCSQCNTNFCYRCGERYRQLRFFGDHTSNLSIFGCKFRYLPEKPHLRRLVRGSVCASKILIAPLVLVLVVVFGAVALVIVLQCFKCKECLRIKMEISNAEVRRGIESLGPGGDFAAPEESAAYRDEHCFQEGVFVWVEAAEAKNVDKRFQDFFSNMQFGEWTTGSRLMDTS